ncbi:MAG: FMN-binding protein [Candidatus Nanopelagicaceae bacterium]|nr:FMN-binding protein [Candidatus Nanopelagicaceae bacterium]
MSRDTKRSCTPRGLFVSRTVGRGQLIRKTAFLITGTVAGVVGVLSYNPPQLNSSIASSNTEPLPEATPANSPSAQQVTPDNSPSPVNSKVKNASKPSTDKAITSKPAAEATTQPTPAASKTETSKTTASSSGTFAGETAVTRWGPVQVQVTIADGKITDVTTLQYPNGDRKSLKISNQVIPWLQQEVLKVQSANISGISGATYTSMGFRNSLASALQKAGL